MAKTVEVFTSNDGVVTLIPVFCEVTGSHIAWRTLGSPTAAYISFEVVQADGTILQPGLLADMRTF